MIRRPAFRRGLRDGAAVGLAVAAIGVAFGVLALQAGFERWVAILASILIVSGAAQFAMVGLAGSGVAPVLIGTAGLALRHIPMSARISTLVENRPLRVRLALAWVLTIAAARRGEDDIVAYKAGADLLLYSGWVAGTVAGSFLGSSIDPSAWGAEVFFALMFVGLAAPLLRNRWDAMVAVSAVGATFAAAALLPPAWRITAAAAAAATLGMVLPDE
jgi:predicted branched-subunit amino acid permease